MATAAYVICALTSLTCTVLLARAWRRTGVRLLLWSFLCFTLLSVNNIILVVDLSVVPETDLSVLRAASGLAGLSVLLFGLIFEVGRRR
jgi:uncharacterized membrane protein